MAISVPPPPFGDGSPVLMSARFGTASPALRAENGHGGVPRPRPPGRHHPHDYYMRFLQMAQGWGVNCLLETATWGANSDRDGSGGTSPTSLARENVRASVVALDARAQLSTVRSQIFVSGAIGPRRKAYAAKNSASREAMTHHSTQIQQLSASGVDVITAHHLTSVDEAVGIVQAAGEAGVPCAITLRLTRDGMSTSGRPVGEMIDEIDATTDAAAAYFVLSCADPQRVGHLLDSALPWVLRVRGVRASGSFAGCNDAAAPSMDPQQYGELMFGLHRTHPHVTLLGSCCGVRENHIKHVLLARQRSQ